MNALAQCRRAALPVLLVGATLLSACTTTATVGERAPDAPPPVARGPVGEFELAQYQRAKDLEQKGQLAEAAWAWEVLTVLRPQEPSYRERLIAVQGQVDAGVAERMQKAQQAQAKGDLDGATQHYLTALSLQPDNAKAADALRVIEKERNRRSYLGTPSRITLRRGAEGKPMTPAQAKAAAVKEAREAKEAAAREAREAKETAAREAREAKEAARLAAKDASKDASRSEAKAAVSGSSADSTGAKAGGKDAVKAADAKVAAKAAGAKDGAADAGKESAAVAATAAAATAATTGNAAATSSKAGRAEASGGGDRNELEHIAMLSAQGEVDEAIALLERRSAQDRRDPSARRLLADLYVRKAERVAMTDRAGGINWLQKCLKIDGKHPRALALMRQWIDASSAADPGNKTVTAAGAATRTVR
ncbi:hypothetical protein [Roseateles terrae]|uniref:Tetratricopeptide repeat protein n=1 Tax=Roseateles terrae TaxID=431060 RepID=A0ABR6GMC8_9BURK|nr:hypothetical protein [Roseateles terrae]MBB3193263.1 hypothetical protein [Roseateles terrae]OWQ89526.1 hypothetical protein CDN98_03090 [Roseateles terrae]